MTLNEKIELIEWILYILRDASIVVIALVLVYGVFK